LAGEVEKALDYIKLIMDKIKTMPENTQSYVFNCVAEAFKALGIDVKT
jgi:hypothetical protein